MIDDVWKAEDSALNDHSCEADRAEGGKGSSLRRRTALKALGLLGVGTVTFRRALAVQAAQAGKVTPEMIKQAEWIAGLELTDKERESAAKEVAESLQLFAGTPQGRGRPRRRPGPVVRSGPGAQAGCGRQAQPGQSRCVIVRSSAPAPTRRWHS